MRIPFNKPYTTGMELNYIAEAIRNGHLSSDGPFTKRCQEWLESRTGSRQVLLTNSCTAALEMAALLINVEPGDEIIMPSYTFVSTVNAFVLRGGVPVFVDIRPDTLNLDEKKIESAIGSKTKAIVPVHYAAVSCDMDAVMEISKDYSLFVVEDAAHGTLASYKGRELGSFGHMAALSFHETKNVISGEGGALLINDTQYSSRAEIFRDKGTNRCSFNRGEVDKYTWVDVGSSYSPSDLSAAFLWAQLQDAEVITKKRLSIWDRYHAAFIDLEQKYGVRRPIVPNECVHNGHMYYLLMNDSEVQKRVLAVLDNLGINAVFHYIPLHLSEAGRKYATVSGRLSVTEDIYERIVRLPLWAGMNNEEVSTVIESVYLAFT
ncbi:MAG TPA: dTDP-4-amino-4,6-dideoxygalactose transaminase [candidate division Zixibacteria bacterium]|nr:dTDP-4-amino-4,6-dideoxygalactose transaminase [candidate division Zixibacteria bacterium]